MKDLGVRIGEINIVCTDAAQSLRFYRDILGFDVTGEEKGCWHLTCGETRFVLLPFAGPREERPSYCLEPAFSIDLIVADLDAAKQHLDSNGVEILSDPSPDDSRLFIRDPDGLVIEVIKD